MAPSNVYFENSTEIYILNKLIIISGYFYIYAAFIKEDRAYTHGSNFFFVMIFNIISRHLFTSARIDVPVIEIYLDCRCAWQSYVYIRKATRRRCPWA